MFKKLALILKYGDDIIAALSGISSLLSSIEAGKMPSVAPLGRLLFKFLPDRMKEPLGTITEREFVDLVFNFAASLQAVMTKTKA